MRYHRSEPVCTRISLDSLRDGAGSTRIPASVLAWLRSSVPRAKDTFWSSWRPLRKLYLLLHLSAQQSLCPFSFLPRPRDPLLGGPITLSALSDTEVTVSKAHHTVRVTLANVGLNFSRRNHINLATRQARHNGSNSVTETELSVVEVQSNIAPRKSVNIGFGRAEHKHSQNL